MKGGSETVEFLSFDWKEVAWGKRRTTTKGPGIRKIITGKQQYSKTFQSLEFLNDQSISCDRRRFTRGRRGEMGEGEGEGKGNNNEKRGWGAVK
jgi:hypothetical protein